MFEKVPYRHHSLTKCMTFLGSLAFYTDFGRLFSNLNHYEKIKSRERAALQHKFCVLWQLQDMTRLKLNKVHCRVTSLNVRPS